MYTNYSFWLILAKSSKFLDNVKMKNKSICCLYTFISLNRFQQNVYIVESPALLANTTSKLQPGSKHYKKNLNIEKETHKILFLP